MKRLLISLVALAFAGPAFAGNIIMTGHDVLLHSGQNGFDEVALDYIRDGADKSTYNIAVVGTSNTGSGRFTGTFQNVTTLGHGGAIPLNGTLAGYGSAVFWDATTLAAGDAAGSLAGVDAVVIMSHTSCGGCSLTTAGADALESISAEIAAAFNAGLDLWVNSGASDTTYYDFLPASVAVTGPAISGSTGFRCTAEGSAVGFRGTDCATVLPNNMLNGHQTHNRFETFDPDFDVFEIRGDDEFVTIGLRDGIIGTDDISTDDGGDDVTPVPEPGSLALLGLGLLGVAFGRRRRMI